MATDQQNYDIYQNAGGGQTAFRRMVRNNPESYPMSPVASTFGLLGWSLDPIDISTPSQAIVSGTQYFVRLMDNCNFNKNNNNVINKVGVQIGTTAAATPGTFSGMALYSYVLGATTMTKLADTGADNGAAVWVAASTMNYAEGTLTAGVSSAPGVLYGSFIATFTTMPNVWANASMPNLVKIKGVTLQQSYSLAAQTSFAASITVSSLTAGTFVPLMGIANS